MNNPCLSQSTQWWWRAS
ncbi:trp operon leader peptide [Corynebacterium suranareeae]|nr:trp operon leader peptide [Corynebacterium suranareeae]